jgi:hypothetical protein
MRRPSGKRSPIWSAKRAECGVAMAARSPYAARERVIGPVVAAADKLLARRGREPLPEGVTAHKLRHTFASILYVRGEDPAYVMAQLGHTHPGFILRVYAHAMRREEGDKDRLRALVDGRDWALLGTGAASDPVLNQAHQDPGNDEVPGNPGTPEDGRGGFRTCDLSRVKRDEDAVDQPPEQGRSF